MNDGSERVPRRPGTPPAPPSGAPTPADGVGSGLPKDGEVCTLFHAGGTRTPTKGGRWLATQEPQSKDSRRVEPSIIIIRSDGAQKEIPLTKQRYVIGRQADAGIRLPDGGISRQHAEIVIDDDRMVIKDLGSSNGTFVNRKRVSTAELTAGDLVSVGPFVIVICIDGEPPSIDAEEAIAEGKPMAQTTPPASAARPAPTSKPAAQPASAKDLDDSDDFNIDDFLSDDSDESKL